MGARELLDDLTSAGFQITARPDRLVIRPASKLTNELRDALRSAKTELLTLLHAPAEPEPHARPYRLSPAAADAAHAQPWGHAAIVHFVARVSMLMRSGFDAADADDLAERLHLRDVQADDRSCCIECKHYRPGRCGNSQAAGLQSSAVGRDLAAMLQRCPGNRPHQIERAQHAP